LTEKKWLASADPLVMLLFLDRRLSTRKRLLFECGCCRLVEHLLRDLSNASGPASCRRAVEVTERYADGEARRDERRMAADAVRMVKREVDQNSETEGPLASWYACRAAAAVASARPQLPAWQEVTLALGAERSDPLDLRARQAWQEPQTEQRLRREAKKADKSGEKEGRRAVAGLLRDVFGNPFRRAPAVNPAWLACSDGAVPRLAQVIYADREFDRLPVLADALEDAGCTDAELLGHLRSPGPHVRGCWAVDLVLGKTARSEANHAPTVGHRFSGWIGVVDCSRGVPVVAADADHRHKPRYL
jgi:hypothetical protein